MTEDILVSDYLKIEYTQLEEKGIFDAVVNRDSAFFINILRLKKATTEEFKGSYQRINDFFVELATLLENADDCVMTDKCFKTAYNRFNFSEVNGVNLGFSASLSGSGFGPTLRRQVVKDAYVMVKKGIKAPELFHLMQLFEENVGADRLSDMIATIIYPDIEAFTRRVEAELGISEENYPDEVFKDGLWINPYKKCPFLFLPKEILHELPIAKDWSEIDDVERKSREKSVQRLIHLSAKYYLEINNIDMSCEANEGPGPVDFKISRGNDKTVVELKLSSNQDYMHGYEEQVERYAKAERTENMLYVLVDVGNPIRVNKLVKQHEKDVAEGKWIPDVITINANQQVSASKH